MRRALPSRQNPAEGLSTCIDSLDDSADHQYSVLKHLSGTTAIFWSLTLVPRLVSLYEWLYDCQGHVLSQEESMTKSMGDLFKELSYVASSLNLEIPVVVQLFA